MLTIYKKQFSLGLGVRCGIITFLRIPICCQWEWADGLRLSGHILICITMQDTLQACKYVHLSCKARHSKELTFS